MSVMSFEDIKSAIVDANSTLTADQRKELKAATKATKVTKTVVAKERFEQVGESIVIRTPGVKGKPRTIAIVDLDAELVKARKTVDDLTAAQDFVFSVNKSR